MKHKIPILHRSAFLLSQLQRNSWKLSLIYMHVLELDRREQRHWKEIVKKQRILTTFIQRLKPKHSRQKPTTPTPIPTHPPTQTSQYFDVQIIFRLIPLMKEKKTVLTSAHIRWHLFLFQARSINRTNLEKLYNGSFPWQRWRILPHFLLAIAH